MSENIFDTYPNKRDLYYVLKRYDKGLFALSGLRKVGKTILLKQIAEYKHGAYVSAEVCFYDKTEETHRAIYNEMLNALLNNDVVCFDEITLIDSPILCSLLPKIREYHDRKLIIITGSYPLDIDTLMCTMCRGYILKIYDLSYHEYCRFHKCKPSSASLIDYFKHSFLSLNTDSIDTGTVLEQYLYDLKLCIYRSWVRRNQSNSDRAYDDTFLNSDKFLYVIDYIREMSELTYKHSNILGADKLEGVSDFTKLLKMSQDDKNRFHSGYKYMTSEIDEDILDDIIRFMRTTELGLEVYDMCIKHDRFFYTLNETSVLLSMPWLLTVFNDNYHEGITDVRMSKLIEYYFRLCLTELNYCVGKYRFNDTDELDVVAIDRLNNNRPVIIECKYQKSSNINKKKIKKYASICSSASIFEYFITCIDDNKDFIVKDVSGNNVTVHLRTIYDLLYELSSKIYSRNLIVDDCESTYNETSFDWS